MIQFIVFIKHVVHSLIPTVLTFMIVPNSTAEEIRWQSSLGVQNTQVEDSNTFGINGGIFATYQMNDRVQMFGMLEVYADHDKDKLDPDHIPIWFQSAYSIGGQLYQMSPNWSLDWELELQGKRNTVSSVEKQFKLFPALKAQYQTDVFNAELKSGVGYYYLEVDDDVPKLRGYERGDFGHDSLAYTLMFRGGVNLTEAVNVSFRAQNWLDEHSNWLEQQWALALNFDTPNWTRGSHISLSVVHSLYNLDLYAKVDVNAPSYLPILPWDSDTLFQLSFVSPW